MEVFRVIFSQIDLNWLTSAGHCVFNNTLTCYINHIVTGFYFMNRLTITILEMRSFTDAFANSKRNPSLWR